MGMLNSRVNSIFNFSHHSSVTVSPEVSLEKTPGSDKVLKTLDFALRRREDICAQIKRTVLGTGRRGCTSTSGDEDHAGAQRTAFTPNMKCNGLPPSPFYPSSMHHPSGLSLVACI